MIFDLTGCEFYFKRFLLHISSISIIRMADLVIICMVLYEEIPVITALISILSLAHESLGVDLFFVGKTYVNCQFCVNFSQLFCLIENQCYLPVPSLFLFDSYVVLCFWCFVSNSCFLLPGLLISWSAD